MSFLVLLKMEPATAMPDRLRDTRQNACWLLNGAGFTSGRFK